MYKTIQWILILEREKKRAWSGCLFYSKITKNSVEWEEYIKNDLETNFIDDYVVISLSSLLHTACQRWCNMYLFF